MVIKTPKESLRYCEILYLQLENKKVFICLFIFYFYFLTMSQKAKASNGKKIEVVGLRIASAIFSKPSLHECFSKTKYELFER